MLYHGFLEQTSEISQLRSKGTILGTDIISGDLKQSHLKSDRFLKLENSVFMAYSEVPNPASFAVKINIFKVTLGLRVFAWKLILYHNYTCQHFKAIGYQIQKL